MSATAVLAQALTVGRDAHGVIQLSGNHNTVTVIVSGDAREPPRTAVGLQAATLGPNPYRSLLAFDEASSRLFFGREALTATLLDGLRALLRGGDVAPVPRLLGILGASGSGKSSIARAGLIPFPAKPGP
jgi:hypothetical protein